MYRLYIDEVGNDDMSHTNNTELRYLSLTGVAMKVVHARDYLTNNMNWIKANVFDHDVDDPIIFHRSDIVRKKKGFRVLNDDEKCALFDEAVFRILENAEYSVISAFVDKKALLAKVEWRNNHPYHFLMEIIMEKYTQFLERQNDIGDIMPEGRKGKADKLLQSEYEKVRSNGTYYVNPERMQDALRSNNLKFRYKKDNVAGLQLADLLAHPSHMHALQLKSVPVNIGSFCERVISILVSQKYDRSHTGKYLGYGMKSFP